MPVYRSDLPERPKHMLGLPLDERGYPVPWFVATVNGKPDFRVVRTNAYMHAFKKHTCWLCGQPLGVFMCCVIGPMCGVNRITSEPGCHMACAEYAVKACPHLTRPLAVRNERDMPAGGQVAGLGLPHNPGACMIWSTKKLQPFAVNNSQGVGKGVLFKLGEPAAISFWAKGRRATRQEIDEAVSKGLPLLRSYAEKDGPAAVAMFNNMLLEFAKLLPAA